MESQAQAPAGICKDSAELTVLPSPLAPWTGAPLRVMVVTEKPLKGVFSLTAPDGRVAAKSSDRHGGSPYFWLAEIAAPAAGTWHATLALNDGPAECRTITHDIAVSAKKPAPVPVTAASFWQVRGGWNIVRCLDRKTVRRTAGPGSVLEGVA